MDRTTLRALIEAGRARFDEALAGFSDAAMLERIDDEWTRKDVVAHVEAWERRVVRLFEALRAGGATDESDETDELNAALYRRDRDRSLADVRSGERGAYAAMLAALDGATDEELFDGDALRLDERRPLRGLVPGATGTSTTTSISTS